MVKEVTVASLAFPQCPWATSTAAVAEYFVQTCCLALGALGVCMGTMALRCTVDFKHLGKSSFQFVFFLTKTGAEAGEPERNNVKVKRPEGRQPECCKWKTPLYTEQRVLHLPNAATFQYSSSWCGGPQRKNDFCCYFITIMLLLQ